MNAAEREERTASAKGELAAERLQVLWSGARDGLFDWDLTTDELRVSARWKAILGHAPDELGSRSDEWFRRVHPRDLEELKKAIECHLAGETPELEGEFRVLHKDSSWRWVQCRAVASADRRLLGGSFTDVTGRKRSEDRLLHEFFHEALTGLPNRALFLDRLGHALQRQRRRRGQPIAVFYVDLDRFHTVNDSLGVDAGDELLVEVSRRLSALMRLGDTLAHLSADKFGVILDGVAGERDAVRFADELGRALRPPLHLEGHELFVTASIGIALSDESHLRAMDLLRDAITAMHRAKEDGATRHELFDPEMNARAKERLQLEADLHHALDRRQFLLHYQPIIDFKSGELSGFEALLRWQHHERGLVRPDVFIPIAEETGLILPLGAWVLEEACRQACEWHASFPTRDISMAVNLSARQFEDPHLVQGVADCIARTGMDSRNLKLEMTESVVMARTHENASTLRALQDLGVRLLIDDFGTGYSSLASLHSFPLDTLKIDRSFVSRMEFEDERAEIVRTILALAKKLDMVVIAEGVETAEQLSMLRKLDCEFGQGYYFSTAIDGESAAAWIRHSPSW
jgi:diguanylate cyclase (GGDEF)-like protein/PAS domain S-box-containing protein